MSARRGRSRSGGRRRRGSDSQGGQALGKGLPESGAPPPNRAAANASIGAQRRSSVRMKAAVSARPMTAPSPRSLGVIASEIKRRIILVTDDGQELSRRPGRRRSPGGDPTSSGRTRSPTWATSIRARSRTSMGGIDAAFVDFGLEKNGFLYVDEVTTPRARSAPAASATRSRTASRSSCRSPRIPWGTRAPG